MTSIVFTEIVPNSDIMPVFLQKYSRTSPQRTRFVLGCATFFIYLFTSLFIENKLIVVVTYKYTTRSKYINKTKKQQTQRTTTRGILIQVWRPFTIKLGFVYTP